MDSDICKGSLDRRKRGDFSPFTDSTVDRLNIGTTVLVLCCIRSLMRRSKVSHRCCPLEPDSPNGESMDPSSHRQEMFFEESNDYPVGDWMDKTHRETDRGNENR